MNISLRYSCYVHFFFLSWSKKKKWTKKRIVSRVRSAGVGLREQDKQGTKSHLRRTTKKKNSLRYNTALRRYKTANAVICVFAYRQKSLSAPKTTARINPSPHPSPDGRGSSSWNFNFIEMRVRVSIRPLRSEQSLFATQQQGGICLNDSELSRLYVEHSPSRFYPT